MNATERPERANTHEHIEGTRAEDAARSATAAMGNAPGGFSRSDTGFRLHVIATGSKGNASVIETRSTCLLVDCGISKTAFMQACDRVGFDPTRISAVLVTHEHTDHTKGIGVVMRGLKKLGCEPTIYATEGTRRNSKELMKLEGSFPIHAIAHDALLSIGALNIQCIPTSHDAADPICLACETTFEGNRDVLGYVTDTGIFPEALRPLISDARLLALESNHDPDMLANGPYPASLKARIRSDSGHLSNGQSDSALESVLGTRLETVIGMHLSETNNRPVLARSGFERILERNGHAAQAFIGCQDSPISIG